MKHNQQTKPLVQNSVKWLVVFGIIFHLIYILSIFDIYFRTPLIHGMTPQVPTVTPPANRLVLFVADGLRADKFYELDYNTGKSRAPFLRSIVLNNGSWGVSHTRVPTESRPGHVAMIAGFYEDVSAVTKGWKHNPVEFDSVFNESRYTWSWGSPDILPMFGDHCPHVFMDMYDPDMEDFGSSSSQLDTWVFERVEKILKEPPGTPLYDKLRSDKVVFFLHLLGLDTNGHAYRPFSSEYYNNIEIVDQGIEKLYKLFESTFPDKKTSYVFTADHGMSNKGSHGDGEKANTETPLVAWGAGIRGPLPRKASDPYTPPEWSLDHLNRVDVPQADIAPLMSTLIGVPPPLNSIGIIPTDYINESESFKSESLFQNARQILSQFIRKSQVKQATSLWFRPFHPLEKSEYLVDQIELNLKNGNYKEAEKISRQLIDLAVTGLNYFQKYDWAFLMSVIVIGYAGWMAYVSLFLVKNFTLIGSQHKSTVDRTRVGNLIAVFVYGAMCLFLALEQSPILYYLYTFFPVAFWTIVFYDYDLLSYIFSQVKVNNLVRSIFGGVVIIALLEMMVVSYFYREILSLAFILLGLWPYVMNYKGPSSLLKISWCLGCWVTAIFPSIPSDVGNNTLLVVIGGSSLVVATFYYYRTNNRSFTQSDSLWLLSKILFAVIATVVVFDTERNLATKSGLPFVNQVVSWLLLAFTVIQLTQFPVYYIDFLVSLFLALSSSYILLSINFEVLFYVSFGVMLFLWIKMEEHRPQESGHLSAEDIRTALFYLFFFYVAFFGTGNVASISSFEISSTYRFTTIFNPFLMGALLLFKIAVPFFLVILTYRIINRKLQTSETGAFLIVVVLSEVMTVNFFFLVKDYGSWRDIGMSIGHFGICSAMLVAQLLFFGISGPLLRSVTLKRKQT